jgi:hypothetical protein
MIRKIETFPPVTMGHIRGHGCRDLLVYLRLGPMPSQRDAERSISFPMTFRCGRSVAEWYAPAAA